MVQHSLRAYREPGYQHNSISSHLCQIGVDLMKGFICSFIGFVFNPAVHLTTFYKIHITLIVAGQQDFMENTGNKRLSFEVGLNHIRICIENTVVQCDQRTTKLPRLCRPHFNTVPQADVLLMAYRLVYVSIIRVEKVSQSFYTAPPSSPQMRDQ